MTSGGWTAQAVHGRMSAPPGEPLLLYAGPLVLSHRGREPAQADGRVWLRWREGASLLWSADAGPDWAEQRPSPVTGKGEQHLLLDWAGLPGRATTWLTETGRGWLNEMLLGDPAEPVDRVLASWVNMPAIRPTASSRGTGPADGRWVLDAAGWRIGVQPRTDLDCVLAVCTRERLSAVTHTMELRRSDGRPFTAARAAAALDALHMAVSFAAGRWTCPAAPVGMDADGSAVWARWAPLHCDHAGRGSNGWWARHRTDDLEAVVRGFLAASGESGSWSTLQYLASAAVVAGESGFVEQRLSTAAAALEHLVWTADVLEGPYTRKSFDAGSRASAHERLRQHLQRLRVPLAVDSARTPVLAACLPDADGPTAVLRVRNMLTHPKTPSELYEHEGLVGEAARLACRYLDLGILHRIGYAGHARDRTKTTGWAGDAAPVPWAQVG